MRTDSIKCSLVITIPVDQPDRNGNVYTKEAVLNALQNIRRSLPIVVYIDRRREVIGHTIGAPYTVQFNHRSHSCEYTIDGQIYFGGTDCLTDVEDGVVKSFDITAFGFST